MIKAVVDTNVVVSSLLQPLGPPAAVLDLVLAGAVDLVVNDAVLAEYAEVLSRPKFGFPKPLVAGFVDYLAAKGSRFLALPQAESTPDPNEQVVWNLAATNNAIVVTGNTRYFTSSENVMTPSRFAEYVREASRP